jgi:flagellar biosynthesis protein FliQ
MNKNKRNKIIYIVIMSLVVACIIVFGIIAMYASGYTIESWCAKFWPWIVLVASALIIMGGGFYFFLKMGD